MNCILQIESELVLVEHARLLMTIDDKVCTIEREAAEKENREVVKLQEQVASLTEQVAALTTTRRSRVIRCFACNKLGHTQNECRSNRRANIRCCICNQQGHLTRECTLPVHSGNDNGAPLRAGRRPANQ